MCGDVSGLDLLGKIDFLCLREGEGRKEGVLTHVAGLEAQGLAL